MKIPQLFFCHPSPKSSVVTIDLLRRMYSLGSSPLCTSFLTHTYYNEHNITDFTFKLGDPLSMLPKSMYFDYWNAFCKDAYSITVKGYNSVMWRLDNEAINALALFSCVLLSPRNYFLPCVLDIKLFRAGLPSWPVLVGQRMPSQLSRDGYTNNIG